MQKHQTARWLLAGFLSLRQKVDIVIFPIFLSFYNVINLSKFVSKLRTCVHVRKLIKRVARLLHCGSTEGGY